MRRSALIVGLAVMLGSAAAVSLLEPAAVAEEKSAQASSQSRQALATAQAKLAWRLIAAAAPGEESIVSPAGLASVFSIIGDGADAKMASAIVAALGFAGVDSATGLATLREARASLAAANSDTFVSRDRIVFAPDQRAEPGRCAPGWTRWASPIPLPISRSPDAVKAVDDWVKDGDARRDPRNPRTAARQAELRRARRPAFQGQVEGIVRSAIHQRRAVHRRRRQNRGSGDDAAAGSAARLPCGKGSHRRRPAIRRRPFLAVVVTSTEAPKSAKSSPGRPIGLRARALRRAEGDLALPRFALDGRASLLPMLGELGLNEGLESPTAWPASAPASRCLRLCSERRSRSTRRALKPPRRLLSSWAARSSSTTPSTWSSTSRSCSLCATGERTDPGRWLRRARAEGEGGVRRGAHRREYARRDLRWQPPTRSAAISTKVASRR